MISLLRRGASILWFPFSYGFRMVTSSARLGWDILTPGSASTPAFVEVPLRCRTDLEITAVASMVSLTPGTVTVALRKDPPTLWVHGMYVADDQDLRDGVHAMEDRLLGVTRTGGAPARPVSGKGGAR